MPLLYPVSPLDGDDVDQLLAGGFRRSGSLLYYTRCAPCHACEPTRVEVNAFRLSNSFKRVLRRADKELTLTWQAPVVDPARVRLYNAHRAGRNLGNSPPIDMADYRGFLTDSCWPTLELEMRRGDQLIGISIMDVGSTSVSAVYTHFDPAASRYSPGTLGVLKQLEWAAKHQRRWVYLGLYVSSNPHLNYKSRYLPQQRLIHGEWVEIRDGAHTPSAEKPSWTNLGTGGSTLPET
ncbi:arginyl-tRNA-protein transferase [Allorhodopirellula heiligendammensis]|uniref:Arginyl-tRNA-protein transferase n=2 Tax=Allorhodopirellula heiligendammensis TaxID=2714739 RepID=A0A5C6BIA9_9BACT|nr:arginyl-tRNA-protein transferase [Allorhodopirellula heiligendammensis]|tara:strand:+ start:538 stop:1245 length:708 start_codon:yes stop_codon:yes gene_type:complete